MLCLSPVNDMSKDHGGPLSHPLDEEEVLSQSREEAKRRVQQLRKLSTTGNNNHTDILYRRNVLTTQSVRE